MLERLAVDQAAEGASGFGNPTGEQCPDFVEQPAPELLVDAPRHTLGDRGGGQPERDRQDLDVGNGRHSVGKMRGERAAGQKEYLECTHQSLQVARLDSAAGLRIHARQHAVDESDAAPRGDRLETTAQRIVASGSWKQAAGERPEVEAGPTYEHWQLAARVDVANRRRGITGEL